MSTRRRPALQWFVSSSVVAAVIVVLVSTHVNVGAQPGSEGEHWVGTWATALMSRDPRPQPPAPGQPAAAPQAATQPTPQPAPAAPAPPPPLNFNNQTLRQIVHTSIGGSRVRVVLSNVFGTASLEIGGASIAVRDRESAIVTATSRPLTFDGRRSLMIPPGAALVSDAVALAVAPLSDLAIDVFLPRDTEAGSSPLTLHGGALQTNYVSATGNHVGSPDFPVKTTTRSWFFLARVEISAPASVGAVAAIGDSITDGSRSTPDTNNRWPDQLARRLAAANMRVGVLNVGIGGNRLLEDGTGPNALARFDRDVLTQPGVTHVIILEGINDIRRTTPPVAAADLLMAHRQLVERAHGRGLKVYGALLTPFEGSLYTPENEAKRQAIIAFIRGRRAYDGVIDFDAAVRDASHATRLAPEFDSDDHIHPNDKGYRAMGDAISLDLFRLNQRTPATRN
jgi:lysophospholipase L1-like esterase